MPQEISSAQWQLVVAEAGKRLQKAYRPGNLKTEDGAVFAGLMGEVLEHYKEHIRAGNKEPEAWALIKSWAKQAVARHRAGNLSPSKWTELYEEDVRGEKDKKKGHTRVHIERRERTESTPRRKTSSYQGTKHHIPSTSNTYYVPSPGHHAQTMYYTQPPMQGSQHRLPSMSRRSNTHGLPSTRHAGMVPPRSGYGSRCYDSGHSSASPSGRYYGTTEIRPGRGW